MNSSQNPSQATHPEARAIRHDPVRVSLTFPEMERAMLIGGRRQLRSIFQMRADKNANVPGYDSWKGAILGAAAELAVAKALGVEWLGDSEGDWVAGAPDLISASGAKIEVRCIDRPDNCLIVRERDADDRVFVLVLAHPPFFDVLGWIYGRSAKIVGQKRNPHGGAASFFVEKRLLFQFPDKRTKEGEHE